ncbi:glycosyltransferase family 2 protein [Paracoccus lutimaris]|uniref:Dolichol-phosphate mannosyltransferase n=1 Tax=Paracoccus lutimaris TaxID=1490030 RepID=A0A368Z3Q9_9RHOB|nr:glycosyltransferase family 2 protein [Paracoccus lutimaris]RCW87093.1 dolichol-phosphate mannosyltransferase [Paracoccus lutimaris]
MHDEAIDISVVIPVRDEAGSIAPLLDEVAAALAERAFEVIVVDDGSGDGTSQILQRLATRHPRLRHHRHPQSRGQSAAIRSGVRLARGPLIVTLDGDGQNPPDQIPVLLAAFDAGNPRLGLVQGQRLVRQDNLGKKLASRLANRIRMALLHDGVSDSGCGLKAFRREAYLELPFFDHIHRFMPAMMLREGWQIATAGVMHRPRGSGRSKYSNIARGLVGIPDLLGAAWLIRRSGRGEPAPPLATGPHLTLNARPASGPAHEDIPS